MKEFQDGLNENIFHSSEEIKKEIDDDSVAMDQDSEEGVSEDEEGVCQSGEEHGEEESDPCPQAKADQTEGEDREAEVQTAGEGDSGSGEDVIGESGSSENYSCSYKPPYYVPDFTVVDGNRDEGDKRTKGAGKHRPWLMLPAILVVVLALLGGVFIGLQIGLNEIRTDEETPASGEGGSISVSKNDSSLGVSVEIDSEEATAMSIEQVVEKVADTVVEIVTTQVQTGKFGYEQYVTEGAGSGVLIDKEGRGYIITNHHVISDDPAQTTIIVRLTNGREYEAEYVAGDEQHDIAVLKIDETGLPYAVMGSSADLKVGQRVLAIGNPLGELGGTVTDGIISAKDRLVIVEGNRMTLLQTNAAINPGNSGGGLFDMAGRLIGIVNAKQSASGIEGLGFAIPIDIAWQIASDLIQYGYVTDQLVLPFTAEYRDDLVLSSMFGGNRSMPEGVYIMRTGQTELKQYDRIVSMNGQEINSIGDYYRIIDGLKKGDTLSVTVSRLSGIQFSEHTVRLTVVFTEAPNQ